MRAFRGRVLFVMVFPSDEVPLPDPITPVPVERSDEGIEEVFLVDGVLSPVRNLYQALPSTVMIIDADGFVRYRRTTPRPSDWSRLLNEILPD
jgi:hypothetical protein